MASKYTVKKGDTLGAIAKKLGTSVDNLKGYRSGNKDLIFPGEEISVKSSPNDSSSSRTETIKTELSDTEPTSTGFDMDSLNNRLTDYQTKREQTQKELDGFRTQRYEELAQEKGLDNSREEIDELDSLITQKKNERDQAINKIRNNPGASAATLTGEVSRATDLLNDEINNLTGQRNNLANSYNSTLAEIDNMLGLEVEDLQSNLDFYTTGASETSNLIQSFQEQLIEELRRTEDREFEEEENLTDFEQALELARMKSSGSGGANYTILTDPFGQPTVAIDRKNPNNQVQLQGDLGSVAGTDPAMLESLANKEEKKGNWFTRLLGL